MDGVGVGVAVESNFARAEAVTAEKKFKERWECESGTVTTTAPAHDTSLLDASFTTSESSKRSMKVSSTSKGVSLKAIASAVNDEDIRQMCELCLLAASAPGGYRILMSAPHAGASEVQSDDEGAFAAILSYLFVDLDVEAVDHNDLDDEITSKANPSSARKSSS